MAKDNSGNKKGNGKPIREGMAPEKAPIRPDDPRSKVYGYAPERPPKAPKTPIKKGFVPESSPKQPPPTVPPPPKKEK